MRRGGGGGLVRSGSELMKENWTHRDGAGASIQLQQRQRSEEWRTHSEEGKHRALEREKRGGTGNEGQM